MLAVPLDEDGPIARIFCSSGAHSGRRAEIAFGSFSSGFPPTCRTRPPALHSSYHAQ